jgi:phosphate starvation-inducible PhoH-like protein
METLRGIDGIGMVEFDKRDIVRHPLVKYIVDAFDKRAEREAKAMEGAPVVRMPRERKDKE